MMIYLECEPDKALVRAFGIARKEIKHMFSKGNVCNRLEKTKNSKGLVDEDPLSPQPSYIGKLKSLSRKNGIRLLFDEKKQNYLIALCPRLEDWVLNVTKEANIDVSKYGLPNDPNKLHEALNIKLDKFSDLIDKIKQKSEMLKTLEGFIKK
jgi:hypothetical protein